MPGARPETAFPPPAILRRDTWVVLACLLGLTALSWWYLLGLAADMTAMSEMDAMAAMATTPQPWGWTTAWLALVMWSVMMAAMMLPSATPMVLLVARTPGSSGLRTGLFVLGYLAVWSLFSVAATALQGALQALRLLSDGGLRDPLLAAGVLVAAGVYQWTPLKGRCLEHCRSPLAFMLSHWRPGRFGVWRLGLAHGAYCVGCCWVLMLLLFVSGVMNLLWAAALAVLVLLEKVLRGGRWVTRAAGVALVLWGAAIAAGVG